MNKLITKFENIKGGDTQIPIKVLTFYKDIIESNL